MSEIITLLLLALALSLDAFAVSISCGLKLQRFWLRKYGKISLSFAIYQAIMPLGGYLLGKLLEPYVSVYSKLVSFLIFFLLGIHILWEVKKNHENGTMTECQCNNMVCLSSLSVAVSIDAFLAGIVISLFSIPLVYSLSVIGLTTFLMSFAGCFIGYKFNLLFKKYAQVLAGLILLVLAFKSLYT